MYKSISFIKDKPLADEIQDFANKRFNGNFTEAFKYLAIVGLTNEKEINASIKVGGSSCERKRKD